MIKNKFLGCSRNCYNFIPRSGALQYWETERWHTSGLFQTATSINTKFDPLPNDKILDVTKLKAFADDHLKVAQMMVSFFDWVENTVGKGENAGNQTSIFSFYHSVL